MKTSVIGFPRVGELRELKFATEKYWRGDISAEELNNTAKEIRKKNWDIQQSRGIDFIPSNDFSFYDTLLDTAAAFNIIPKRYKELGLSDLDTYFAMARGYQGEKGDVKALAMKKWFNTNYHYMVPEFEDDTEIKLANTKAVDEYKEAKALGIQTKTVIAGPFTLLKLTRFTGTKTAEDISSQLAEVYIELLSKLAAEGAEWVQLDEPYLVRDLTEEDIALFEKLYGKILAEKSVKILLQTYFGDVRDIYEKLTSLDFDGTDSVILPAYKSAKKASLFVLKSLSDVPVIWKFKVTSRDANLGVCGQITLTPSSSRLSFETNSFSDFGAKRVSRNPFPILTP